MKGEQRKHVAGELSIKALTNDHPPATYSEVHRQLPRPPLLCNSQLPSHLPVLPPSNQFLPTRFFTTHFLLSSSFFLNLAPARQSHSPRQNTNRKWQQKPLRSLRTFSTLPTTRLLTTSVASSSTRSSPATQSSASRSSLLANSTATTSSRSRRPWRKFVCI